MSVASKNLFAALGSDDEEDTRPVAKPTTSKTEPKTQTKRSSEAAAPRGPRGGAARGGRGGGAGGDRRGSGRGGRGRGGPARGGYSNDDAYNDREEVHQNREREAGTTSRHPASGRSARPRGGREYDRHSQTGRVDTQKSTNQGWGNETTAWESAEPIAEADRNEEKKQANEPTTAPTEDTPAAQSTEPTTAPAEPEKESGPEDNTLTYSEWVAAKAAGKSEFGTHEVRQSDQSKWGSTQSLLSKKARIVDDALFGETPIEQKVRSASSSAKKVPKKIVVEIEQRFTPLRPGRGGDRGVRGGERSRGSGERGPSGRGRGGDGDRPSAPRGGRGGPRADGDRGGRGGYGGGRGRGGRPSGPTTVDVNDETAFPALG